ncbi:trafficking protein particle complex subunit 12-like [Saccoglossus kowalevskii]
MEADINEANVSINIESPSTDRGDDDGETANTGAIAGIGGAGSEISHNIDELDELTVATGHLDLGEFAGSEVDLTEPSEPQFEDAFPVETETEDSEQQRPQQLIDGFEAAISGDFNNLLTENERPQEFLDCVDNDDDNSDENDENKVTENIEEASNTVDDQQQSEATDQLEKEPPKSKESTSPVDEEQITEDSLDGACVSSQIKDVDTGDMQPVSQEKPDNSETNVSNEPELTTCSKVKKTISVEIPKRPDDGFEVQLVGSPGSSLLDHLKTTQDVDPPETNTADRSSDVGVRKFFTDEVIGTSDNIEGKNFFDSFTTGGLDSLGESSSSIGSRHSGSFSQVEIPSPKDNFHQVIPSTPPIDEVFSSIPAFPIPTSSHQPFHRSTSSEGDDPFAAAIKLSDVDRRYNAWIPPEATRQVLVARVTSPGAIIVDPNLLTMPAVLMEETQGDPVKELVHKFMGEQESNKRQVLTLDTVSQNEEGLQQLIAAGCYRSAIDLTARILDRYNQGIGALGKQSLNTPLTLQIWFTRISLMMKLRLFSAAEAEIESFGNLDRPDLFFEFYPDLYPGKRGSMVPFSFRVLHAEIPQYNSKAQETIDKLYYLHAIVTKIISNLESGLAEDGSGIELSDENRKASLNLWNSRLIRVLYSIGNCLVFMKDYNQASNVYKELMTKEVKNAVLLWSGIGRLHLQLGDVKSAEKCFKEVETIATSERDKCQVSMNK